MNRKKVVHSSKKTQNQRRIILENEILKSAGIYYYEIIIGVVYIVYKLCCNGINHKFFFLCKNSFFVSEF